MSGKVGAFDRIDRPPLRLVDTSTHPFKVTFASTSAETDAKVFIEPGTVLGIVPNILGVAIDNITSPPTAGNPPTLSFNENGMVLIRVNIDSYGDTFRPSIVDLTLNQQNSFIIKDDDNDPLNELTMIWDNDSIKDSGYFYIRVANIICGTPDPPAAQIPTITRIVQFLNKNIYSFIIVIDEVIILSS